jgi:DNA anti-recombination protein RmuC
MEVIRNRELGDWMNEQHVFPVSPNTLLMTLHTISLVHKWYEVASRFEKSRAELAKAQKSFDFFQNQFENVGKNLNKAQEAFETAQRHLKNYRGKVTALSGQEQLELDTASASIEKPLPLLDKPARSHAGVRTRTLGMGAERGLLRSCGLSDAVRGVDR